MRPFYNISETSHCDFGWWGNHSKKNHFFPHLVARASYQPNNPQKIFFLIVLSPISFASLSTHQILKWPLRQLTKAFRPGQFSRAFFCPIPPKFTLTHTSPHQKTNYSFLKNLIHFSCRERNKLINLKEKNSLKTKKEREAIIIQGENQLIANGDDTGGLLFNVRSPPPPCPPKKALWYSPHPSTPPSWRHWHPSLFYASVWNESLTKFIALYSSPVLCRRLWLKFVTLQLGPLVLSH